jgi:hypothetical protein
MISSVSSSQANQVLSGTSSNAQSEAALEKQIAAKEAEAKEAKDQIDAAKIAQEIATLKAKLAALQAKDKQESEGADYSARTRQAEFDQELLAEQSNSRTI